MGPGGARHLLVVGGGHSHLFVLRAFAEHPVPGLRLSLISPTRLATYSGMVPGVLAGQYALREAQVDLEALAQRAGAAFVSGHVTAIDTHRRRVELGDGSQLTYDLLSLDIGARPAAGTPAAAGAPVVSVKPIEQAAAGIGSALAAPGAHRALVVGAGAGGAEIAFALAARLRDVGGAGVTVCDRDDRPVHARGHRTATLVERAFAAHRIRFIGGAAVTRLERNGVELDDGRTVLADLIVWATGAAGPPLFRASRLPVDARGFLLVGADLRCIAHPEIFAAGDCATLAPYPELPKAGVFAVRQGPILAHNLRAVLRGGAVRRFRPQRRALALLNTGDGRAILSYGPAALCGRCVWHLKDRIDRAFVRRFDPAAQAIASRS
jgi:selenide, water dikinase